MKMNEYEEHRSKTSPAMLYQPPESSVVDGWVFGDTTQAFSQSTPFPHAVSEQPTSNHRDYEAPSSRQKLNTHFGNEPLPHINSAEKEIESNVMNKQPNKSSDTPDYRAETLTLINPELDVTSLLTSQAEQGLSTRASENSNVRLRDYTQALRDHHDRLRMSQAETGLTNRGLDSADPDSDGNTLDIRRCVELAGFAIREGGPVRPNTKWPSEHDDTLIKLVQVGASLEQICDAFKPRTLRGICQHVARLHRSGKIQGPLRDDIRVGMTLRDAPRTNEERSALLGSPPVQRNNNPDEQAYLEDRHWNLMEAEHGRVPTTETASRLDPLTLNALRSSSLITTIAEGIRESPNAVQSQDLGNVDDNNSSRAERRNNQGQAVEIAKRKIAKGGPIIAGTLWATEHDGELARLVEIGVNLDQICALFQPRTKSAVCRRALMFYESGRIDGLVREDILKGRGDRQDVGSSNRSNSRNEPEPPHASSRSQRRVHREGMPYTKEEDMIILSAGRNGGLTEELAQDMNRPSARALKKRHAILSRSSFSTSSVVLNRERRRSSSPISQENISSAARRRRPAFKVRENRSIANFMDETRQQPASANTSPQSSQQESIRDSRNYKELTALLESNQARYGDLLRQFEQGPSHHPQMLEQIGRVGSELQEENENRGKIKDGLKGIQQSVTFGAETDSEIHQILQTLIRSRAEMAA